MRRTVSVRGSGGPAMRRLSSVRIVSALALAAGLAVAVVPADAAPQGAPPGAGAVGPTVYVGDLTVEQLGALRQAGLDREDISTHRLTGADAAAGRIGVEVVVGRYEAAKLITQGIPLREKTVDGQRVSRRMAAAAAPTVFRSYSEPGGIRDELRQVARQHPRTTKLETIGRTVQGQRILAIKVTRHARHVKDGRRPAVLYSSAQHAREWITPEMNRRLLHYVLDHRATNPKIRRVLRTTELWFVPV